MIADIRFWEQKASEGHYAIPHFNVWNAEMLMGVIDAAEELRAPIIISFGTGFTGNTSFEDFCYMMESMAKKATVPVILHWDHGRNWTILKNAVDHCMNSVMRDASALPYEEMYLSFISIAAAFVNVTTRICSGLTLHLLIKYLTRSVITLVFPEPGPASTSAGPVSWRTALF